MIHSPPASLVWWQVYNEPNDDVLSLQKWWHDAFCLSRRIFWIVKVIVIFFRWSKKLHPEPFWGWGPVIIMISVVMILLPPSPRYGKYGKLKMAPLPCSNIIWTLTMNAPILIPVSSSSLFTHDVLLGYVTAPALVSPVWTVDTISCCSTPHLRTAPLSRN